MATIALSAESFDQAVLKEGTVLVDFWAAWCGPCRMFAPIFEEASEKYPELIFAKVDTEAEQSLSAAAGISSIPTLMAFRDGILLFNQAGALPASGLDELITAINNVDMNEIRVSLSEQPEKS